MRYSKTPIILIISILVFSIFVANLANIISTDNELLKKVYGDYESSFLRKQEQLHLSNTNDHLMWFVQVSDIHISIFESPSRIEEFKGFVHKTLEIIKPKIVLASGDLTDAKDKDKLGSRQYLKEWQIYKNILDTSNITKEVPWLDIRGNHDNFNVPNINSEFNFFTTYSIQGTKHQRSYLHQITEGEDKYSFIAVDACLEPGPKRPFNFIGLLDVNETTLLSELINESKSLETNYTIWFGHYPTSCILTEGIENSGGIRDLIGSYDASYAYLCGHLHTQAGMVPNMYTFQKAGFLELELGDWKSNRLFRVAAFDHGLFSFIDVQYNDWPIVLVTNPKHALFNIPGRENPYLQISSSYIRVLIFSPTPIIYCSVQINNDGMKDCQKVNENLYVVPWKPDIYKLGIHSLQVIVESKDGKVKVVNQPFSLDGSRMNFDLLARFVLMIDACALFRSLFGIAVVLCVIPLTILRIFHELVLAGKCKKPKIRSNCIKNTLRKLWILSSIDRLYIPLIVYCLYITIGPWAIGEVIDGYTGVIFVWGIFVNNSFLPGSLSYLYGFFQLTLCQLPLIFIYANEVTKRLDKLNYTITSGSKRRYLSKYFRHIPFICITIVEIILAFFFWWAYGTLAFIVGPFRTWSIIFNIIIWYCSINIPEECLRSATAVFYSGTSPNESENNEFRDR